MAEERVILAGFGGQGVLSMGKIMCFAGMAKDLNVSWLPSYGPEMRGGTANCQVIISDEDIAAPVINGATAVVAFNEPSLVKFEGEAESGAAIIVNSSLISRKVARDDVKAYYVPVNELAQEAGSMKCLNVVMLGAYTAICGQVEREVILNVLKDMFMKKSEKVYLMNQKAFELGEKYVKENMYWNGSPVSDYGRSFAKMTNR